MEDIKIGRLGWAGNVIRMEEERIRKKVLNGNFYTSGKTKKQMGRCDPEGCITADGDKRVEEKS